MNTDLDVVVVGSGLSGLATALAAAVRGLRVVVLEKGEKLGGASAYSGGQVWIPGNDAMLAEGLSDTIEDGATYVRALSHERPDLLDEDAMTRWLSTGPVAARWFEEIGAVKWSVIPGYPDYEYPGLPGSKATGRYISAIVDGHELGPWRERMLISPHFPVGVTYDELMSTGYRESMIEHEQPQDGDASGVTAFGVLDDAQSTEENSATDLLTMGPGVVGSFLRRLLQEDGIEIRLGHRVTELLVEDGRVVGVRAETPIGEALECRGSVVLATSGFDHDPQLVKKHWGVDDYASMAPSTLEGDGIRLGQSAGAAILHIPGRYAPIVPGYRTDTVGSGYAFAQEHSLPHTFIVDATASRFADDASYWVLVHAALDPEDQHVPLYMVWDEQHHQRYGLGQTPPGGDYPADLVSSAPTVRELGRLLGLDGEALQRTTARFNEHAARGEDPDFGRGTKYTWQVFGGDPSHPIHPNTAPVEQSPFYGMPLVLGGTGVGMTGVKVDSEGRAVDEDGAVVPGLFAVGSAAAFTSSGSGYNSGMALSRAVTFGYIVAEHVAAQAARAGERVAG